MKQEWWSAFARSRVNPLVPAAAILTGLALLAFGYRWIGAGVAVGALLAYANGLMLSGRVDLAAATGNIAGALMVMQLGFLAAMVLIGLAEIVLVRISLSMAVASAAGFGVTQLAILATFYLAHGRTDIPAHTEAS